LKQKTFERETHGAIDDAVNAFSLDYPIIDIRTQKMPNGTYVAQVLYVEAEDAAPE